MDRAELSLILAEGPIRIRMNDGRAYDVLGKEFITISDIAASVLCRHEDGKLRHVYLPLVTISAVEHLATAS